MSFIINLHSSLFSHNTNFVINNTKPVDIVNFYRSFIDYIDYEINLTNKAIDSDMLDTVQGGEEIVKYTMDAARYPLSVSNYSFPAGYLSEQSLSIKSNTIIPNIFDTEMVRIESGADVHISGSIFNAEKVVIECGGRLYIENSNFKNATVTVNNRVLTSQEVKNIDVDVLGSCPIKMTLTLNFRSDEMPTANDIRDSILEVDDMRQTLLEHVLGLEEDKTTYVSILEKNAENLEKCANDFIHRIIDIDCDKVAGFDF